jgi:hypothetical protein
MNAINCLQFEAKNIYSIIIEHARNHVSNIFPRTSNQDEIAIRLATRRAEQKLRQDEHELNMEMMKQRVKTAPLLLEGPTQLAPRLGHIYHHCDVAEDKKKVNNMSQLNVPQSKSHYHHKGNRPGSTISTDSKLTESSINCI